MKKFLRFLPVVALLAGIFGIVATPKETIKAEAVAIPASQVLYLKPSANWLEAGARFAAYFYTDSPAANEWKDLIKEPGVLDIYKVVAPATSYANVIFTRMNPDTTENIWANKWSQSPNLEFDGTNDLYVVSGWDAGAWDVYDPLEHPLPPPFSTGLELYFKNSGTFMDGATRMAAHFFIADGGADPKWAGMTQVDTGIYQVVTPTTGVSGKEFDRIIFVSMVADNTEDALPEFDWTYKVNQTTNLMYDGTNTLFDNSDLTWKAYSARPSVTLTATTEGIDSSKVRIWLDRNGHYESGYTWAMKIGATLYQPTGFEKALKLTGSDRFFAFYDMPISVMTGNIGFSVVNSFLKVDVEVPAVAYTAGDNNKVWKVDNPSSVWTLTKGAITERVYNTFFARVLEGYLTCDVSAVNGYMAFGQINTNFLPKIETVWNLEGDLSGVLIKDFESEANYATGTREATAATDAYAKYTRMHDRYLANGGTLSQFVPMNKTANVGLIALIGLLGLTAIAGFYFLKTKKQ